MKKDFEDRKTITHDFPIWRTKADFILATRLAESDVPTDWKWEQIWARQMENSTFEICCIPFVSYGLALGDQVNTKPFEERTYVVNEIIQRSGHQTYRVWFNSIKERPQLVHEILNLKCLVEERWKNSDLVSVSVPNPDSMVKLEKLLRRFEETLDIEWESGM